MDDEIEKYVASCSTCQETRPSPPSAPLHPWQWPSQPWSRLHLDFAGPYMGHMFLIIADAHSKWLDAHIMSSITSTKTIEILRTVFATHGLPRKIVTDNGPSFTSQEFRTFMEGNGIKHVTSAPYHPSTNGLAERAVQTVKLGIKRTKGQTIQERLSRFLFNYRITPHPTTGVTPSELLLNRRPRSRLDLLHPQVGERVESQQQKQKENHDGNPSPRKFDVGETVYVKNLPAGTPKWIPGVVEKVTGPLSYVVKLKDGRLVRRHVDHVRKREAADSDSGDPPDVSPEVYPDSDETQTNDDEPPDSSTAPTSHTTDDQDTIPTTQPIQPRRSDRTRKPVERYDLKVGEV